MSYVAPVSAVLIMRCTASAATSAGPTTRPIGSVAAQRAPALLELIPQQRRRQRRVDKAGSNEVYPDGRELECERRREWVQGRRGRRNNSEVFVTRRPPVPPMNTSEPPAFILPAAARATARYSTT